LAFRKTETNNDDNKEQIIDNVRYNFHHMLKAKAMAFRTPIQLVIPSTYGEKLKIKDETMSHVPQDEATRAWNFFTAIYYKANGTPWRLPRISSELSTCYLGVSFYRSLDEKYVNTSIAQIFNELGDGIIIRGAQAQTTKEDLQPHLKSEDAENLIDEALKLYRKEHKNMPARIVLHKSSHFTASEKEGFISAINKHSITEYDFISIRHSDTKLFRFGCYPPLRGMFLDLDEQNHVIYTRGSVYFYETYPGMYVPHPISFKVESSERPSIEIAKEILALTKMNWNSTQFDHAFPITICAARRVGDVLKYLPQDTELCPRYSYYM
jgi:argonaute-like protein implicated in RNA metabolism and viral defense